MIDRLFTLTLTVALLAGGALAIGGEFFAPRGTAAQQQQAIAQLPRVVVTGSVERPQTAIARAEEGAAASPDTERTQ